MTHMRIGRLTGIEIGANWSWLLVVALVVWTLADEVFPSTNPDLSGGTYVAMAIAAALLFSASIVLHELGHARQARREGMEVGGITLWALGGIARFTGMFPSPATEFRVAIAGPAVSLLLGVVFVALAAVFQPGSAVDGVVAWLGYINLLLFAFNLIPALPMDGGRVLRSALWRLRGDLVAATRIAAGVGFALGAVMVAAGLLSGLAGAEASGLWIAIIGAFVMMAGRAEADAVAIRAVLGGHRVHEAMSAMTIAGPPPAELPRVDADADLATSVAAVLQAGATVAAVVERGEVVGLLDVNSVMRRVRQRRPRGLTPSRGLSAGR